MQNLTSQLENTKHKMIDNFTNSKFVQNLYSSRFLFILIIGYQLIIHFRTKLAVLQR